MSKQNLFDIRRNLSAPVVLSPDSIRRANGQRVRRSAAEMYPMQPNYGGGNGMSAQPVPQQYLDVEQLIDGQTVVNPALSHDLGGVAQVPNSPIGEPYFTLIFDNSSGVAPVRFRFGSDTGAALLGLSGLPRATGGSVLPSVIDKVMENRALLIGGIFYNTSSDQSQFSQEFTYHRGGKLDGSTRGSDSFPVRMAKRPTYENDLLLILQSQGAPWRFGEIEVGTITVLDGEVVTLDFALAATGGN